MHSKNQRSAIISGDGILELPKSPVMEKNEDLGVYALHGHMRVPFKNPGHVAYAQDLHKKDLLQVIGKSGSSRVGLELMHDSRRKSDFDLRRNEAIIPVQLASLRNEGVRPIETGDLLVNRIIDTQEDQMRSNRKGLDVGRLVLAHPDDALDKDHLLWAIEHHRLAFGSGFCPETDINDEGVVELSLESLYYKFFEDNFDEDHQRDVLLFGKHALNDVQKEMPYLPENIHARRFFVGGIKISLGPFTAIIDQQTNDPEVIHLAARVLDGVRTTGLGVSRQVELFNKKFAKVLTADLRIRLRIFHADRATQDLADKVINTHTIQNGVAIADILELKQHPERIIDMMRLVSPSINDGDIESILVGPGRMRNIRFLQDPEMMERHLCIESPKFAAAYPGSFVSGFNMAEPAYNIAKRIGKVGRNQNHRNAYFSWSFPSPDTISRMLSSGIGAFYGYNISKESDQYNRRAEPVFSNSSKRLVQREHLRTKKKMELSPHNDMFFSSEQFHAFDMLHRQGAEFFQVTQKTEDAFGEVDELPEEVMQWIRWGFFVRPESMERMEKVDTIIAMYGSHVSGTDEAMEPGVARFLLRMKRLFGDHAAVMHGKGPGIMYLADRIARNLPKYAKQNEGFEDVEEPMISIGIGIDLEQANQAINHHPDGQLDFKSQDRLTRQKHMNDRESFRLINLGGAGTLEEIALTLCSLKLHKNISTPIIFVDEFGLSKEGENFWLKLQAFLDDMCEKKVINVQRRDGSSEQVTVTNDIKEEAEIAVQLLNKNMKNFISVVDSYDEAAEVIEELIEDPVDAYIQRGLTKDEFEHSFAGAIDVRKKTGMPMPHWIAGEKYAEMLLDERWPV